MVSSESPKVPEGSSPSAAGVPGWAVFTGEWCESCWHGWHELCRSHLPPAMFGEQKCGCGRCS